MQHRRPDPTRQYPAHQLDAEAFASEIMAKPLSVRRSLNAQGLGKPEMVPCSKFYSDGHAWVVDRQGPVEHRAHCGRSEEHTYELQSLMRISYAVFCLKK